MTLQEKLQQAITGLKYMKRRVHENSAAYYWYDIAIRSLEAWDKVWTEMQDIMIVGQDEEHIYQQIKAIIDKYMAESE